MVSVLCEKINGLSSELAGSHNNYTWYTCIFVCSSWCAAYESRIRNEWSLLLHSNTQTRCSAYICNRTHLKGKQENGWDLLSTLKKNFFVAWGSTSNWVTYAILYFSWTLTNMKSNKPFISQTQGKKGQERETNLLFIKKISYIFN